MKATRSLLVRGDHQKTGEWIADMVDLPPVSDQARIGIDDRPKTTTIQFVNRTTIRTVAIVTNPVHTVPSLLAENHHRIPLPYHANLMIANGRWRDDLRLALRIRYLPRISRLRLLRRAWLFPTKAPSLRLEIPYGREVRESSSTAADGREPMRGDGEDGEQEFTMGGLSGLSGLSARLRATIQTMALDLEGVRGVETIISTRSPLEEERPRLQIVRVVPHRVIILG
jgi:hypothetical protein